MLLQLLLFTTTGFLYFKVLSSLSVRVTDKHNAIHKINKTEQASPPPPISYNNRQTLVSCSASTVTGFIQSSKILWSCTHMNCCLQNYIIHQFTHVLYFIHIKASSKIQEYKNPTSTSRVINKTSLKFWKNTILICISFEFQANRVFR